MASIYELNTQVNTAICDETVACAYFIVERVHVGCGCTTVLVSVAATVSHLLQFIVVPPVVLKWL